MGSLGRAGPPRPRARLPLTQTARIRPARPDEAGPLAALMAENYAEAGLPMAEPRARAAFEALLGDDGLGAVWIAEAAGQPIGYAVLALGFSLEYGGRDAFLDDLFVRPAHRGAGVGRQLLEAAVAACRRLGVGALHLEVERSNQRAQALYRGAGFRDNDRRLLTLRVDRDGPDRRLP